MTDIDWKATDRDTAAAETKTPALPEPFDRERFEQAPCYVCGYNGPDYYQPASHPCATLYHEEPLYTATQLSEALDRADRAERERDFADAEVKHWHDLAVSHENTNEGVVLWKDRATTAEAALEGARKVIEGFREVAEEQMKDGGPVMGHYLHIRRVPIAFDGEHDINPGAFRAVLQWLSANPEVKG